MFSQNADPGIVPGTPRQHVQSSFIKSEHQANESARSTHAFFVRFRQERVSDNRTDRWFDTTTVQVNIQLTAQSGIPGYFSATMRPTRARMIKAGFIVNK